MQENKTRIFLVDDDEIDAMSFERALKKSGYSNYLLKHCKNAPEALEEISRDDYDCIFLDYQLPGVDGLELLKRMREQGINTPIAVMTSQGDEKIAVEMMKAGAFDYFPKAEVNPDNITKIIRSGLRLKESETQKVKFELALKENMDRLNTILESTSALIFSVDKSLRYTAFNSCFQNMILKLYSIEPELGLQAVYDFDNDKDRRVIYDSFKKALEGEHITITEEFGDPEKCSSYFEMSFNPIIDAIGQISGIAVYGQDFSKRKKEQLEILESKFEAERTAKAKSEFLSNMSHEIRTPMNAIIGLSELLLKENLTDKQLENMKSIKFSADNLLVIINDILDFSKIESGKIEFESLNFDIFSKVHEIRKTFIFKAEEKGIGLKFEIDERIPQFLMGDPFRLNQILLNLLSNAVKFTKEGTVSLLVNLVSEEDENLEIEFNVVDTGIGIPKDKLASVFESYTQAYTDITRRFGGTGLGLAITRQLVTMQNGEITLDSEPGVGTTFTVRLKFRKGENDNPGTPEEIIADLLEKRDFEGMKVLLVEDNVMNQFVACQVLELWNIKAECALNGLEAVKLLETNDYALVLMDLQMPVMSGYEATAFIRDKTNKLRNPDIPIIALTADAFPETRKKVLDEGMNDFVTKPLEQNDLYNKIRQHALKMAKV
jgi:signal transduction histidine kinase/two-component SAPR family response regulator